VPTTLLFHFNNFEFFPPLPVSSPSQREGEEKGETLPHLYPPPPKGRGRIKKGVGNSQNDNSKSFLNSKLKVPALRRSRRFEI